MHGLISLLKATVYKYANISDMCDR